MSRFEFRIDVEAGDRPTESFEGVCLLDEADKRKLALLAVRELNMTRNKGLDDLQ